MSSGGEALGTKAQEWHGPFKSAAPPLPGRIQIPGGRGGADAWKQRARAAPVCGGAARLRPRRGDAPRGGGVSQVSAGTPRIPSQSVRRWAGRCGVSASQGCVTLTGHAPSLDQAASTAEARGGHSESRPYRHQLRRLFAVGIRPGWATLFLHPLRCDLQRMLALTAPQFPHL